MPRRAAKAGSSRGRGGGRSSGCEGGFDCCVKAAASGILVSSYEGGRSGSAVSGSRLMSVMAAEWWRCLNVYGRSTAGGTLLLFVHVMPRS